MDPMMMWGLIGAAILALGICVYCCCFAQQQKHYVDDGEGEEDEYADDYNDDYFASDAEGDFNGEDQDYGEECTYYDDFSDTTEMGEEALLGGSTSTFAQSSMP